MHELIMRGLILATIVAGLFGVLFKRNLLLRILAMDIMGTGIISLFVFYATHSGRRTPTAIEGGGEYADPVLQAVILTAIVIGFSIVALLLVAAMYLARRIPSLDVDELEAGWKEDG